MLRPKTKKRLMILLIGSTATFGVAIAAVIIQLRKYENHLLAFRAQGLNAYHHGDYRTAAKNLGSFLGNDRVDGEAIFAYAVSRSRLPRPDMGNLLDAKRLFNRYLELSPGDADAEHQLLEIYGKLHYPTEVMDTANDLLQKNPDDVPALSAKLQQLVHDQKFSQALPISMQLNELTPFDARTQEITFDLMAKTGKNQSEILDRGNRLLAAHPADPRFELVRALAAYFTSDLGDTKKWLLQASTRTPPDGDFTLLLAGSFDHLGMWNDARSLLERTATQPNASSSLKAKFIQRLWEAGKFDIALAVLKDLNPQDPSADSHLLGLNSLVLFSLNQPFNAQRVALSHRPDDPTAAAWVLLLNVISQASPVGELHAIEQCQTAEKLDPENVDVRFYIAQKYLTIGESELALQALQQTAALQPEWSAPQAMMAQIYLDRGQSGDAIAPAQLACDLDPDSLAAKTTLAMVGYRRLGPTSLVMDIKPVLDYIQQVRKLSPNDPKLIAANVDLLAQSDSKDAAKMLATISLSDSPELLHQLAIVDKADQLGLAQLLGNRAMAIQMTTAEAALDQVRVLATIGDVSSGQKIVEAMALHTTPDWQLALLQACEALHENALGPSWKQFADSQPRNLAVQLAAMHSPIIQADRTAMDHTINRVRALCSDDAIEWKLARAEWQLADAIDIKNSANAAAALMAEVVRQVTRYAPPQVIWSDALEKLGDINGAIAHLKMAIEIEPENGRLKIKLTALSNKSTPADNAAALLQRIHEIKPPSAYPN